jgi:hypothetical protein
MLLRAIYLSKKVVACRPLRSMANGDMSTCQGCLQFGFIPTITPEIVLADLTQKTILCICVVGFVRIDAHRGAQLKL